MCSIEYLFPTLDVSHLICCCFQRSYNIMLMESHFVLKTKRKTKTIKHFFDPFGKTNTVRLIQSIFFFILENWQGLLFIGLWKPNRFAYKDFQLCFANVVSLRMSLILTQWAPEKYLFGKMLMMTGKDFPG